MSKNIFQIWDEIGRKTPFAVRRDNWSEKFYTIVEKVEIKKFPYGYAYGFSTTNGVYTNHYDYDSTWRRKRIIPCCGCYQWTLVENVDSEHLKKTNENLRNEIIEKLPIIKDIFNIYGQNSKLKFGKLNGKTISEIYKVEPTYLEWCINNINGFAIEQKTIYYLTNLSVDFNFTKETIQLNKKKLSENKKQYESH